MKNQKKRISADRTKNTISNKHTNKSKRTKKEIQTTISPIALFVRTRREELGYTQEELAFRSGLSAGFLKAFERGKSTVRLDKVYEILNYLGATLSVKMKNSND